VQTRLDQRIKDSRVGELIVVCIAKLVTIESKLGDGTSSKSTIGVATLVAAGKPSPCVDSYSPSTSANGCFKLSTISK
jgi:hypothetical protein